MIVVSVTFSAPANSMYGKMLYVWVVSTLLVCCSNFVIAQSNTCYVTLDTTVPEFCYATLQNRLPQGRLNFTLVNGINTSVTLEFEPLPENHQVELEVVDNSDGLKAWANLANSFVDSVRSGSLPYGKYLSLVAFDEACNYIMNGWAWHAIV